MAAHFSFKISETSSSVSVYEKNGLYAHQRIHFHVRIATSAKEIATGVDQKQDLALVVLLLFRTVWDLF